MLTTENFEKSQEKLDKRGKLGRGAITYDSPCTQILLDTRTVNAVPLQSLINIPT